MSTRMESWSPWKRTDQVEEKTEKTTSFAYQSDMQIVKLNTFSGWWFFTFLYKLSNRAAVPHFQVSLIPWGLILTTKGHSTRNRREFASALLSLFLAFLAFPTITIFNRSGGPSWLPWVIHLFPLCCLFWILQHLIFPDASVPSLDDWYGFGFKSGWPGHKPYHSQEIPYTFHLRYIFLLGEATWSSQDLLRLSFSKWCFANHSGLLF